MQKRINYSTQKILTSGCYHPRDYSYRTNPSTCLECEHCYNKTLKIDKERRRSPIYLNTDELAWNPNLFKEPIIISRFSEPFIDGAQSDASIKAADIIIEQGGKFIFRTALDLPSRAVSLLAENKNNSQLQLKFITDISGDNIRQELSKKFNTASKQLENGSSLIKNYDIDTVAIFDPFIIGVNDLNCKLLIKELAKNGITKLIIKQLFATDRFIMYLRPRIDRAYTFMLNNFTSGYWTYDNIIFLKYLVPVLEECEKYKINVSICSNKMCNDLVFGKNCCQIRGKSE